MGYNNINRLASRVLRDSSGLCCKFSVKVDFESPALWFFPIKIGFWI